MMSTHRQPKAKQESNPIENSDTATAPLTRNRRGFIRESIAAGFSSLCLARSPHLSAATDNSSETLSFEDVEKIRISGDLELDLKRGRGIAEVLSRCAAAPQPVARPRQTM